MPYFRENCPAALRVIVNTRGTKGTDDAALLEVVRYLDTGAVSGDFSRELEDAVNHVKSSEERRHEYMIMMLREQELLEKGREQGWEKGHEQGMEQGREEGREQGRLEGREQGRLEGREQGRLEGREQGEARLAGLIGRLFSLGRDQDAVRAAADPEYRAQLYSELKL